MQQSNGVLWTGGAHNSKTHSHFIPLPPKQGCQNPFMEYSQKPCSLLHSSEGSNSNSICTILTAPELDLNDQEKMFQQHYQSTKASKN